MEIDLFNSIELPSLSYFILPIVIICFGQVVESIFSKTERERLNIIQRELYYRKLTTEACRMEEKELKEELKLAQNIEDLHAEADQLTSQFDPDILDDSDWSTDESLPDRSDDQACPSNSDRKVDELKKELKKFEEESKELQAVEDEINTASQDIKKSYSTANEPILIDTDNTNDLVEKIKQLEMENEELKAQIASNNDMPQLVTRDDDIDPNLIKYLKDNKAELTLSFLKEAHETLLELKASNPEKNFDEYIEELKTSQINYSAELAQLLVDKKAIEIKLQIQRRNYELELSTFNETRIEHLLKNSGSKEYLDSLRERNKVNQDIIHSLKRDLESKQLQVDHWEQKYIESEQQSQTYKKAYTEMLHNKVKIEAEMKAHYDRGRQMHLNQTLNPGSSSSNIENQVPPPPPIDIPSVDELLGKSMDLHVGSYMLNSSIPPPPQVEVPFNEILKNTSSGFG